MLTFQTLLQDPTELPKGSSRSLVELACTHCGNGFHTPRGDVVKSLRRGARGMYCSRTCACEAITARSIVVQDGVEGACLQGL